MPFTAPRFAPRFVFHVGPSGPSATNAMRSRIVAEAPRVKRSGGSQHRSTWYSADITS